VHEKKGDGDKMSGKKRAFLQENAPIALQLTRIERAFQ